MPRAVGKVFKVASSYVLSRLYAVERDAFSLGYVQARANITDGVVKPQTYAAYRIDQILETVHIDLDVVIDRDAQVLHGANEIGHADRVIVPVDGRIELVELALRVSGIAVRLIVIGPSPSTPTIVERARSRSELNWSSLSGVTSGRSAAKSSISSVVMSFSVT